MLLLPKYADIYMVIINQILLTYIKVLFKDFFQISLFCLWLFFLEPWCCAFVSSDFHNQKCLGSLRMRFGLVTPYFWLGQETQLRYWWHSVFIVGIKKRVTTSTNSLHRLTVS